MLYALDAATGESVYLVLVFIKVFFKDTSKTHDKDMGGVYKEQLDQRAF